VAHAVGQSVESYSSRSWSRLTPYLLSRDACSRIERALAAIQAVLELGYAKSIAEAALQAVAAYNRNDCNSIGVLRDWLEQLRAQGDCGWCP